jgi:hypothetical protein
MQKGLWAVVLGLVVAATGAQGAPEMKAASAVGPLDLPHVQVLTTSDQEVDLVFELPVLGTEALRAGSRTFTSVSIPGGGITGGVGEPMLPVFTRLVAIPDGAAVTVTAERQDVEDVPGIDLIPMQADEGASFTISDAAYSLDAFVGGDPAAVGSPAIARDMRVVTLTFRPVQYNAAERTLRVAQRIHARIAFSGHDPRNVRTGTRHATIAPSFDRLYRDLIVNYTGPRSGESVAPGTYLIIAQNDNSVLTRIAPLVEWRKKQGFPVVLATTAETGVTSTSIKAYIQNAYDSWTNPPEYICIVGDAQAPIQLPTFYENTSGYGGEGDHPYTQLAGNDVLADAHIGRLSVGSTTELDVVVAKIIGYESTPYTASDPDWFRRACLTGDPNDSGYSTVQVQQWIKARLRQLGYAQIDTIYADPFVSQMLTDLNKGDTIFCYRGIQGMSGWGNAQTYQLTNGWKMPFAVIPTCATGSFAGGTCRSEGFLRANSSGQPRGAIGAIGTATTGTHTRYNNCMTFGIWYGMLWEGSYNLGAALTRGKYEMYLNYQDVDPNHVLIWSHWNNLMGDPAVECWTGYPDPMVVNAPSTIPVGGNAIPVTVTEGGQPCVGARVCIYRADEVQVVGFTNEQGEVELDIPAATAGNLSLTVTKHNRHPQLLTVPVAGQSAYVAYQGSTLDDDSSGESSGNGDGQLNPGETVELRVQLKNFGTQQATGVTASITCDDPYVTLTDTSETFGDIAAGSTAWSADDFGLTVSGACPNARSVHIGLDVQSGANSWHSAINLTVVAADLVTNATHNYNVGGNGIFDPGETGQISIALQNVGAASATNPAGSLTSLSEYVDVPDGMANYATIGVGSVVENTGDPFTIHIASNCVPGYVANLQLVLTFSGGAKDTTLIQVPVGTRATTDPIGPDAYGYYAYDNTDTAYPEAPTYNWIELDPAYGGSGATEVVLGDYGDYQDKSKVVDMPFPFVYYGKTYTKATICTNGWVAMGSQWNTEYRNWTIPGAGGPAAMIAPFWDDLYQSSGSSKVFQKYDSNMHAWIVEWSHMKDPPPYGSTVETFEAILYDPAYVTTETGDGEIVFQYSQIQNVDSVDGYSTVGIENEDQSVGLLYEWFNRYPAGAANLAANRAIRFIPRREVLAGVIQGTVRNQSANDAPLPGATITILQNGHEYPDGTDGHYQASEAPGVYSVRASRTGFEPDTVFNVTVPAGGNVQVDFSLRDIVPPEIVHTKIQSTSNTVGPYTANATITDPSPITQTTLYWRANGGSFNALTMVNHGVNMYTAAIPGQPLYTKIDYYILAKDSGNNTATSPAGAPASLYTFYVGPTIAFLQDDMELDRGWTVGAPGDAATTGIWLRDDPVGTWAGDEPVQPEDDHTAAPGTMCWVTGNAPVGSGQGANDVDGGRTTLTSPRINLNFEGVATLSYYRWFTNNTANYPNEDAWVVQASDNNGITWVDLEHTTESDRSWRKMEFDLGSYISLTGQVRIRFIAQDFLGESVVEAAVDDVEVDGVGLFGADVQPQGQTLRFQLDQNRPNPFRTQTSISFALEHAAPATLVVYDVSGRVVRTLADGVQSAGVHNLVWDRKDDGGHAVSSGIYLLRIHSEAGMLTRKMILVE